tara:strand:- start:509 stop:1366 length:858 start_codon:yes stop_codon:yes gene_type:complete
MSRNKKGSSRAKQAQVYAGCNRSERRGQKAKSLREGGSKSEKGMKLLAEDEVTQNEDYNLDWFKPSEGQQDIVYSMCSDQLTMVQGGSGCGKSTAAIWQGLKDLKDGRIKQLVFMKTPSSDGDDEIGFLSGSEDEKLSAHMLAMKSIFETFMSKQKLEAEIKSGRIKFTIPNFEAGRTFYKSLIIFDESHKCSESTIKLIVERLADSSRIILLGDKGQRYSTKYRNDGFSSFVRMTTEIDEEGYRVSSEPLMGYVELTSKDNMRGVLSKRIGELYEAKEDRENED